jgi:AraC-like DNA-binding protein
MKTFRKYFDLTTKEADNNLGIKILNLGHHIHPKELQYPDMSHPDSHLFDWEKGRMLKEYQILYIPKGEGYFETNGMKPQHIEAGTVVLLYPGVWHRYKPNEKTGWEEYWIGFSGNYAHYLLEQECFNAQSPILKLGFTIEFFDTFSKLIDSVESEDDSFRKMSSFYLIHLLGMLYSSALLNKEKVSKKEEIIQKTLNLLANDWNKTIDFEQIAKDQNVSYVWFRKTFKQLTGTSPNQYLLMLKIRHSEQLILETNFTISEIAFQCNFESESYFSRIFKSKMGYSPSDLRK